MKLLRRIVLTVTWTEMLATNNSNSAASVTTAELPATKL